MPAPRLVALPAAAAALLAAFLFWRWLGTPVALPEVPASRLHCLSYTPSEPGQLGMRSPGWVSRERIEADVSLLARYTGCLRVYTPLGPTPRVIEAARPLGIEILLGAWIGSDLGQNEKEVSAALELAHRYPGTVTAIVVGNEVLLRGEMSATNLARLIREVRTSSPVPVAYADVAHFIGNNPVIVEAADLLLIHLLPYWDDPRPPPVAHAAEQVLRIYDEFRARHPGRHIMIGETGWPSQGRMRGPAWPGTVEQARFVREFAARASALGIRYNLIEAIDQPWKRASEGTVGGYWGILDEHRTPKFALAGPVTAEPYWRARLAATGLVILGVLAAGWWARPTWARWAGWSALALALGVALVFQWDYALATSRSAWGWIGAALAAALSLAAAVVLGERLAGRPAAPAAPLALLGRTLATPREILRLAPLRLALFAAATLLPAAWIAVTLAFDPRHRDVPLARFALPALAMATVVRATGGADAREEAVLAALLLACGFTQLEAGNPETLGWLVVALLLAWPWRRALGAELARIGRLLRPGPRQAEQRREHS